MAKYRITYTTRSFFNSLIDSKILDKVLTLLSIAIAVYAIIQVNQIDKRQESKEKIDSLYKAKQLSLDSLQNEYIAKSKDILYSIDTSSKSLNQSFTSISQTTRNVPNQIDKVNALLNNLSVVTREHKELIENQYKQRARLIVVAMNNLDRGILEVKLQNIGNKIAYFKGINIYPKDYNVKSIYLYRNSVRDQYSFSKIQDYTFSLNYDWDIPVNSYFSFQLNLYNNANIEMLDFETGYRILYNWDGETTGDYLSGTFIRKEYSKPH